EFAKTVDWPVEDKGLAVVFHYRGAQDEEAALERLEDVAADARELGLVPQFGRKVLEVRPPVEADKGTAVRMLLEERGLGRALYAGDDTTDLDAFRGLERLELAERPGRKVAAVVGVDAAVVAVGLDPVNVVVVEQRLRAARADDRDLLDGRLLCTTCLGKPRDHACEPLRLDRLDQVVEGL